jgi:hypothetical protein
MATQMFIKFTGPDVAGDAANATHAGEIEISAGLMVLINLHLQFVLLLVVELLKERIIRI